MTWLKQATDSPMWAAALETARIHGIRVASKEHGLGAESIRAVGEAHGLTLFDTVKEAQ